jgi:hypothetical protein
MTQSYIGPFIFAALMALAMRAVAQPSLSIEPDTIYFGTRTNDVDFLDTTVLMLNRGTDTLEIRDMHTSCGCVSAWPGASRITFMQTATMRVTIHVLGVVGQIVHSVDLETNDPTQRTHRLTLVARLVNPAPK